MIKSIEHPFTLAKIKELKVGDRVRLTGLVIAGRDRLHKHLADGGKCPVDLRDGAIYHSGPIVVRKDGMWNVVAAGPTTSSREEPYMAGIIERFHVRVIVGKGGMGEATRKACAKHGCVYVHAVGGAAVLLGEKIRKVENVHFLREFGPAEALWELQVDGLEGVVSMDAGGRSLHRRVAARSRRALKSMLGT